MTDRGRETERQIRQRYIQRERDTKRMKSTRLPCSSDVGIVALCDDRKRERDIKRMKSTRIPCSSDVGIVGRC